MSNIKDTIRLLNPWWEGEKISDELAKEYKRSFPEIVLYIVRN